jgi:hypothetical protein
MIDAFPCAIAQDAVKMVALRDIRALKYGDVQAETARSKSGI